MRSHSTAAQEEDNTTHDQMNTRGRPDFVGGGWRATPYRRLDGPRPYNKLMCNGTERHWAAEDARSSLVSAELPTAGSHRSA